MWFNYNYNNSTNGFRISINNNYSSNISCAKNLEFVDRETKNSEK